MDDYTYKPIMRLVTRLCEPNDGLVLGFMLKSGAGRLKPSTVYALSELAGLLVLREVGPALPAHGGESAGEAHLNLTWAQDVGQIIGQAGPYLALSREELAAISPREAPEDL